MKVNLPGSIGDRIPDGLCRVKPNRLLNVTSTQQGREAKHQNQRNHQRIFNCRRAFFFGQQRVEKLADVSFHQISQFL